MKAWTLVALVGVATACGDAAVYVGRPGTRQTHLVVAVEQGSVQRDVPLLHVVASRGGRESIQDYQEQCASPLPSDCTRAPISFPARFTIVLREDSSDAVDITVEARDGATVLARAATTAQPRPNEGLEVVLTLGGPCTTDAQCLDADPCNGEESCQRGVCVAGQPLCAPPVAACVELTCVPHPNVDGGPQAECVYTPQHALCPPLAEIEAAPRPRYCDITQGCSLGEPCKTDADCAVIPCAAAQCVDQQFCTPAVANFSDGNPCDVERCSAVPGDEGLLVGKVVHEALPNGVHCIQDNSEDGICLENKCVAPACNDGVVSPEAHEECDEGGDALASANPNDTCDACRHVTWTGPAAPLVPSQGEGLNPLLWDVRPVAVAQGPGFVVVGTVEGRIFMLPDGGGIFPVAGTEVASKRPTAARSTLLALGRIVDLDVDAAGNIFVLHQPGVTQWFVTQISPDQQATVVDRFESSVAVTALASLGGGQHLRTVGRDILSFKDGSTQVVETLPGNIRDMAIIRGNMYLLTDNNRVEVRGLQASTAGAHASVAFTPPTCPPGPPCGPTRISALRATADEVVLLLAGPDQAWSWRWTRTGNERLPQPATPEPVAALAKACLQESGLCTVDALFFSATANRTLLAEGARARVISVSLAGDGTLQVAPLAGTGAQPLRDRMTLGLWCPASLAKSTNGSWLVSEQPGHRVLQISEDAAVPSRALGNGRPDGMDNPPTLEGGLRAPGAVVQWKDALNNDVVLVASGPGVSVVRNGTRSRLDLGGQVTALAVAGSSVLAAVQPMGSMGANVRAISGGATLAAGMPLFSVMGGVNALAQVAAGVTLVLSQGMAATGTLLLCQAGSCAPLGGFSGGMGVASMALESGNNVILAWRQQDGGTVLRRHAVVAGMPLDAGVVVWEAANPQASALTGLSAMVAEEGSVVVTVRGPEPCSPSGGRLLRLRYATGAVETIMAQRQPEEPVPGRANWVAPTAPVWVGPEQLLVASEAQDAVMKVDLLPVVKVARFAGAWTDAPAIAGVPLLDMALPGPAAMELHGDALWLALDDADSVARISGMGTLPLGQVMVGTGAPPLKQEVRFCDNTVSSDPSLLGARGIAVDANGTNYFVSESRAHMIKGLGGALPKLIEGEACQARRDDGLDSPSSLVAHQGRLYVADTGNDRVMRILDPDGVPQAQDVLAGLPGALSIAAPVALAVDAWDNLWVAGGQEVFIILNGAGEAGATALLSVHRMQDGLVPTPCISGLALRTVLGKTEAWFTDACRGSLTKVVHMPQ